MAQGPVQQVDSDDVNAAALYPQDNDVENLSTNKTAKISSQEV